MSEREWPPGALTTLIDHMAEAVALLDAEGRVLAGNAALSRLTGGSSGEWRGCSLAHLFSVPGVASSPPNSVWQLSWRGCSLAAPVTTPVAPMGLAESLERAVEHGFAEGEAQGSRPNGSPLWLRYRLIRVSGPGLGERTTGEDGCLMAVIENITPDVELSFAQELSQRLLQEAGRREETLTSLNRQLSALSTLSATVSHSLDLETVLGAALHCALEVAEARTGWVCLLSTPDGEQLELVAHRGLPEECVLRHGRIGLDDCMAGKVVVTGKPFVLYSLPADDSFTPYLRRQAIRCVAYIPLRNRDRAIGALGIGSARFQKFSANQVQFLTSVGHQVGLAIGNARLYEQVKLRAEIDPLTGLFNRQRFCELLDQRIAANRSPAELVQLPGLCLPGYVSIPTPERLIARTPEVGPWVLMIDIDNFKQINDTSGHAHGDQALREVAQLLRQCVRAGDILGRYGGDEFVVALCDDSRSQMPSAPAQTAWMAARAVVRRLRQRFAEASRCGEFCVPLTVSIGAARSGESSEHCLQLADEAMYREKRRRKRLAA